ncbi:hypothetical protein BH10ACI4_BH10ACI4_04250 [soil metagenome]
MTLARMLRGYSMREGYSRGKNRAFGLVIVLLFTWLHINSQAEEQSPHKNSATQATKHIPVVIEDLETKYSKLQLVDGKDIRFRAIGGVNGLSQTRAAPTVQDRLGFLWFGTQYGLNRFDGYRFKVFRHEMGKSNTLSGVYVRALFIDHSGNLWVSCDQSLDRFDATTETFKHFRVGPAESSENDGPAIHISEDHDGRLWLATFKGLFMLDPVTGRTIRYTHDPNDPSSLSGNDINFADEDREGTFWVASGSGLDAFDRRIGKVTTHIRMDGHISFMFHEDRFGIFWVARTTPKCPLAILDRKSKSLNCYSIYDGEQTVTNIPGIFTMLESPDGTMWMATEGGGLLKFDRESNRLVRYRNHPEDPESLGADSVISLFEDSESNMWVDLHEAPPYFFSQKAPLFENFTHLRGQLKGSLVTSIFEDRRKILWIGSTGGLNRIDRAKGTNTVPPGVGVEGEVLSIIEDRSGALVAGTFRPGLQQLDPETGRAEPYHQPIGVRSNQGENPIMRLYIDRLGSLWAATWGGLRGFDWSNGNFATYRPDPQSTVSYSDIKENKDGSLWLGGESGLHRFDPKTKKFTIYSSDPDNPHSVSDARVTSVLIDHADRMWLGTQNGFDRFDPKSGVAKVYYDKDGLAGNVVSCILEDDRGTLWMGTNNGLSNFDPATERFSNYSVSDGLPGPDLTGWSTCFRSPTGEMFFGGFSGATAFFPSRMGKDTYTPNIVLTDFRISGASAMIGAGSPLTKSITYTDSIELSHKQNIFEIEFAALSYFNARTNRYRYKLEGLDSEWHEVGSDQRLASYTTLPQGKYTFRVQGATSRGPWSEPGVSLRLRILPPWWETWWFQTICASGVFIIVWGIYTARVSQLAQQYNIRLEERLSERNRIARELHDTLLQGFQGLMLRFQAVMKTLPKEERAYKTMEKVMDSADKVLFEGRQSVQDIREGEEVGISLAERLAQCGEELAENHASSFSLAMLGTPFALSPIVSNEMYRIAREALVNAFHHSHATKIEVELTYDQSQISLKIRDNGIGIDSKLLEHGRVGHWGLTGMRERARKVDCTLNIWSRSGAGTEVELLIPAGVTVADRQDGSLWERFRGAIRALKKGRRISQD